MLIELSAATDSVNWRQETPLQLATKREYLTAMYSGGCRNLRDASGINTIRLLIQRGNNDPMQVDDVGHTSIMTSAFDHFDAKNDMLPWLLKQDECEIDLEYRNPAGHSAAAYISTREDFPELLQELLRRGIDVNSPCSRSWSYRIGPKNPLGGKF